MHLRMSGLGWGPSGLGFLGRGRGRCRSRFAWQFSHDYRPLRTPELGFGDPWGHLCLGVTIPGWVRVAGGPRAVRTPGGPLRRRSKCWVFRNGGKHWVRSVVPGVTTVSPLAWWACPVVLPVPLATMVELALPWTGRPAGGGMQPRRSASGS